MSKEPETVEAVVRACRLLQSFRLQGEVLSLAEVRARTGLSKTTCFRLLQSLIKGEMIERVGKSSYRSHVQPLAPPAFTLGFASQATDSEFSREVSRGIERVARREHIHLVSVDNHYSAKTALRNADQLIRQRVNLVLEFQTYEQVAPAIAAKFAEAGIPLIAIDIPHPGAVYFGADNYRAGVLGGQALGRWVKEHWNGEVEAVLLLELPIAGPVPQLRLSGTLDGLCQALPGLSPRLAVHLNGKGEFGASLDVVRKYLRRTPPRRTLIAAVNDPSALGALRAFEEAGRIDLCVAMGHGTTTDAREELRRPGTRLIGSIAYFPEQYGEELIPLALSILQNKEAPASVFIKHQLITPRNVGLVYPI